MEPSLPFTLADRYDVTAELGRGGFAIVYLARDRVLQRDVAIKILRREILTATALRRFSLEMRVTARLEHPNILHVYDTGTWDERMFYVMEYVRGRTLETRLGTEGLLPIGDALAIARDVGHALAFAHDAGVVHRDVKPANIMLGPAGGLLGDFGIAHVLADGVDGPITSTGLAVGTLGYMSPEQLCAERVDARSDQYSLALVCYEMLTGVRPHIAAGIEALRAVRLSGSMTPVSTHRPAAPPQVDGTIARALAPAPADRFRSISEFLAALENTDTTILISAAPNRAAAQSRPPRAPDLLQQSAGATTEGFGAKWPRNWSARGVTIGVAAAAVVLTAAPYIRHRFVDASVSTTGAPLSVAIIASHNPADSAFAARLRLELDAWRDAAVTPAAEYVPGNNDESPSLFRNLASQSNATVLVRPVRSTTHDSTQWVLSVYDGRSPSRIVHLSRSSARETDLDASTLRWLATRLLVGPAADSAPGLETLPVPVLEAAKSYADGWRLMRSGAFAASRTAFAAAATQAPAFAEAHLWAAQLGAWSVPRDVAAWRDEAVRAASSTAMHGTDSLLADALRAMAEDDPPTACKRYRAAIAKSPDSFPAWFGLAQCQYYDSVVVRGETGDRRPRFRSSHWSAVAAYQKALERLPAPEMSPLFATAVTATYALGNQARGGVSLPPDTIPYLAMPSLDGDTVVFVPLPRAEVMRSSAVPATLSQALARARRQLLGFTRLWLTQAPTSADAWFFRALALELTGNLDAPDVMNSAVRALNTADSLVSDDERRARIAVARVRVAVRQGRFDDANKLAQTALSRRAITTARIAALHAPLSAFLGDVSGTAELLRIAATSTDDAERFQLPPWATAAVPTWLADSVRRFGVRAALGECADLAAHRDNLERNLQQHVAAAELPALRERVLHDAYRAAVPCLGASVVRGFHVEGPLDDVDAAIDSGHVAYARTVLDGLTERRRGMSQTTLSTDALLAESFAWKQIGDTAKAIGLLRAAMGNLSAISIFTFDEVTQAAAFRRIRRSVERQ